MSDDRHTAKFTFTAVRVHHYGYQIVLMLSSLMRRTLAGQQLGHGSSGSYKRLILSLGEHPNLPRRLDTDQQVRYGRCVM